MALKDIELTCAIAKSTYLLGDHWSLLILRDMLLHHKTRFKEFLNSKEKIATNILTNRLKTLTDKGLITLLNPNSTKKQTIYSYRKRNFYVDYYYRTLSIFYYGYR